MRRRVPLVVAALVAGTTLAGCGGQSDYCAAVEEHRAAVAAVGTERTTEAYEAGRAAVADIAQSAPEDVREAWTSLGDALDAVLSAQAEVGVPLEKMTEESSVYGLDSDQRDLVDRAYAAFNDTVESRARLVESAREDCKITLR